MVAFMQFTVHWFCDVSMIVQYTLWRDLRPSAGARRRDSRAMQTGEYANIVRCQGCLLFRNDGENQYSVMHLILFDSLFESESIKHHRDDVKHFAGVLCARPEQITRKKKFTPCLQIVFALHSSEDRKDYCKWDMTVNAKWENHDNKWQKCCLTNTFLWINNSDY